MRNVYIGIDPGSKGYACFYYPATDSYEHVPLSDTDHLRTELEAAKVVGNVMALVENVHALPKQGLSSTFKFGFNVGLSVGMLIALGIPYSMVIPSKWQKEMWEPGDRFTVGGKVLTKDTSFRAARRLHPGMNFRRTDKCKTFDDNMVDATLICDYARRMNL